MKKLHLFLLYTLLLLSTTATLEAQANDPVITMRIEKQNGYIRLGIISSSTFNIDWGDGILKKYKAGNYTTDENPVYSEYKGEKIKIFGNSIIFFSAQDINITDLELSPALIYLNTLYISGNKNLESITFPTLPTLYELSINKNAISKIDLNTLRNLKICNLSDNHLTSIDLTSNKELKTVDLSRNKLTQLNADNNNKIENLFLGDNDLSSIDLGNYQWIKNLDCSNNKLTGTFTTGLQNNLEILDIRNNSLSAVDIQGAKNLQTLQIDHNQISSLDLSSSKNLIALSAGNNTLDHITTTGISTLTSINLEHNQLKNWEYEFDNLKFLYLNHNKLETINVSHNKKLKRLEASSNQITHIKMPEGSDLESLFVDNNKLQSSNLRHIYENLPDVSHLKVDPWEKEWKQLLKVGGNPDADNTGISEAIEKGWKVDIAIPDASLLSFTTSTSKEKPITLAIAAEEDKIIISYGNRSDEITVSTDPKHPTPLTIYTTEDKQKFIIKGTLLSLSCRDNDLTHLNVQRQKKLEILDCSNNRLKSIDVSENKNLKRLYADNNELLSLNMGNVNSLEELFCSHNKIGSIDLTHCQNIKRISLHHNALNVINIQNARQLLSLDITKNRIQEIDLGNNSFLKWFSCVDNRIETLGLEHNTAIEELYCGDNKIKRLDLQHLSKLKILNCKLNAIDALDLHNNKNLEELYCFDNHIQTLILEGLSKLEIVSIGSNDLKSLDLSGLPKLETVSASFNNLERCEIKDLPLLDRMLVDHNKLTSITIENCPQLQLLAVHNNNIIGKATSSLIQTLPQKNEKAFLIFWNKEEYPSDEESNKFNASDIEKAKEKNWIMYDGESPLTSESGILQDKLCNINIFITPNQITINNLMPDSYLEIYSINGDLLYRNKTDHNGSISTSPKILTKGTYILYGLTETRECFIKKIIL